MAVFQRVAHEAALEDVDESLAGFIGRGGLRRVVNQRLVDTLLGTEADELEGPLPATASGVLRRDE